MAAEGFNAYARCSGKEQVAVRLIVDQSLAGGFIPINTQQQRASLPFKPCVLESKVYNNDHITFFSVLLTFAKPSCDNVLQPSLLHCSGYYHMRAWQGLYHPL